MNSGALRHFHSAYWAEIFLLIYSASFDLVRTASTSSTTFYSTSLVSSLGGVGSTVKDGEPLTLWVNKLFSPSSQLTYAYMDMPFVCPPSHQTHKLLSLGEVLRGDRIVSFEAISLNVLKDSPCTVYCQKSSKDGSVIVPQLQDLIFRSYRVDWIIDGLPAALALELKDMEASTSAQSKKKYEIGFPLGYVHEGKTYLYNHVHLNLLYETVSKSNLRKVVGFEVLPVSVNHKGGSCIANDLASQNNFEPMILAQNAEQDIVWTYSVAWHEESRASDWVSRWDLYTTSARPHIHWFAILNSIIIIFFLTGIVAIIIVRTLSRDITYYNDDGFERGIKDYPEEVTGWKLLHGDVFRPPLRPGILCPLIGCGVQSICTLLATCILSVVGIVDSSSRGASVSTGFFLYVFSGVFGGYSSGRLFKLFKCMSWKRNAGLTAFLYPGITIILIFILNLFMSSGASNSLPIGTFFALVAMIIGISLPLVYLGALVGFKKPVLDVPTRTNQIPRQIPEQAWYLKPIPTVIAAGAIPFAVIFLELYYIIKSFWSTDVVQMYYIFGFITFVTCLLVITVAEISIVATYFNLCAEDYRWQWKSFLVGGSSAIYVFLYAVLHFYTSLGADNAVSVMLYLTYSFLACFVYFICCGTIGFYAALWFVTKIFASIKVG